jgi:hypothetical protein
MGTARAFRSVRVIVLLGVFAIASTVARADPAPALVGDWESTRADNAFVMRVSWNQQAQRYDGLLVRNGALSQRLGYQIGELVWTAKLSPNPRLLEILEEWRRGGGPAPPSVSWVRAGVRLEAITATEMQTSTAVYRRLGPPAANGAPGAPPPAPSPSGALQGLPSSDELRRKIVGSDEVDTQARRVAAFGVVGSLLNQIDQRARGPVKDLPELRRDYAIGQQAAQNQLRVLAGRGYVNPYLQNDSFQRELTTVTFPGIARMLEQQRKDDEAKEQAKAAKVAAQEQARAEQIAVAQKKAEEKAADDDKRRAKALAAEEELATAQPDPALKVAAKAGVESTLLGIPLGVPRRTLPVCADNPPKRPCVPSSAMTAVLALTGVSAPPGWELLAIVTPMPWARVAFGQVKKGVLVRIAVSTEGHDAALPYLKKHFGATSKVTEQGVREWTRPGIHLRYVPPVMEDVPTLAGRAPTHKCLPGATDCDGFDEMKADFWSTLPNALGDLALMKATTRPNLIFETETVYQNDK